jgi:hypothetical protein
VSTRRRSNPAVADDAAEPAAFALIMKRMRLDRAIRELARVRCALRDARQGASGLVSVARALHGGSARQIMITTRFLELEPGPAMALLQAATDQGVATVVVNGAGALELDVRGGGVGALLASTRERSSRRCRYDA